MIPGVGLFYGGMVRKKNAISTIIFSFAIMGIISLQWILFGYTLAFGPDKWGIIGGLEYLGLSGVGMEVMPGLSIPSLTFMIFQAMFAVITVSLITGSFVERIKFSSFLVFSLLWATLVYDPVAHWVWGGGWLAQGTVTLEQLEDHLDLRLASEAGSVSLGGYLQERLGRILRPKARNSYFYSLVSRFTVEEEFAANRRKFLAEQGYRYQIEAWE